MAAVAFVGALLDMEAAKRSLPPGNCNLRIMIGGEQGEVHTWTLLFPRPPRAREGESNLELTWESGTIPTIKAKGGGSDPCNEID